MIYVNTLIKKTKNIAFTGISAVLLAPATVFAGAGSTDDPFGLGEIQGDSGQNNLNLGSNDLISTVTSIINVALGLLGIVAVVIILIGGFRWMTAAGREDQIDKAKQTIFAGIIGLAIIMSAWAIATFVVSNLGAATGTPNAAGGVS